MRYAVLGPVEIVANDGPIDLPRRMERRLLAFLVLHADQAVSPDRLIELLWGDRPPRSANKTLQTYVSHLRRFLGTRLRTEPAGYRLTIEADEIDANEFEHLVAEGRHALARRDYERGIELLDRARSLWRGRPYDDVADHHVFEVEATRLDELRMAAIEDAIEARLDSRDAGGVTAELETLVAQHPLRERLWALLMRALYASGRQADALQAFQRARSLLVEELGLEPGPELRAMESAVLTHDPKLIESNPPQPSARYVTTADGVEIAYWVNGDGPIDVVVCLEWAFNLELLRETGELRPLVDRLNDAGRLIVVQRRDTGQSGRSPGQVLTPPQGCVPDLDAVLHAVGARSVHLVGFGHGAQVALAYAAARPERVVRLAAITGYARLVEAPDYPCGLSRAFLEGFLDLLAEHWGRELSGVPIFGPVLGNDPAVMVKAARINRLTATPREAVAMQRAAYEFDVRPLLADVRCPVLVVGLTKSITGLANSRALAEMLPNASFIELPGYFIPAAAESRAVGDAIVDFFQRGATAARFD